MVTKISISPMFLLVFWLISTAHCQQFNETQKEFNETRKEEETPYFIWEQCLNPELDPCDDFYQFACSKYDAEYKLSDDTQHYYSFLSDLAKDQIKQCFLDTFNSDKSNSSIAVQKMRRYQKEYERTGGHEKLSNLKLVNEIKSFGSCPALSLSKKWQNNGIANMLLKMTNLTGLPYLYELDWTETLKDGLVPIIQPSRLIVSNPTQNIKFYVSHNKSLYRLNEEEKMRTFFARVFESVAKKVSGFEDQTNGFDEGSGFGQDENYHEVEPKNYTKIAEDLVDLELRLVSIYSTKYYFEPMIGNFNKHYLNQTEYRKHLGISDIQKYLFNNARISTDFNKYLYENGYDVGNSEFFIDNYVTKYLAVIFQGLDDETLANYLCLRYIFDRMPYLNEYLQGLTQTFQLEMSTAGKVNILPYYNSDTKEHVESTFPLVADHLFVANCKSSPDQIEKAREIAENTVNASINLIQNAKWMDSVSRNNALKILKSAVIGIGASEIALNQKKLDKMYERLDFQEADGIMEMEQKLQLFNSWHKLSALHAYDNPANFHIMRRRASVVNANSGRISPYIFLTLGYLFPPHFDTNLPYSSNYGTVGQTAGHELFHLLDASGVLVYYNESSQSIFGDPKTEAEFETRIGCIEKQYNEQKDPSGLTFKGWTLNEDIADNAAVRVAYYTYLNWLKRNGGEDGKVPGYSQYTNEQSFFISHAMTYCVNMPPYEREWQIENDPHSLNEYRVNIPLRNFPAFSKAFNCSVGTKMNPRKKCRVWKKKK